MMFKFLTPEMLADLCAAGAERGANARREAEQKRAAKPAPSPSPLVDVPHAGAWAKLLPLVGEDRDGCLAMYIAADDAATLKREAAAEGQEVSAYLRTLVGEARTMRSWFARSLAARGGR